MTTEAQEFTDTDVHASADIENGLINVTADIAASPDAVFHALTDPAQLAQWWGSPELYQTERWEVDLRPGGKWVCNVAPREGADPNDPPQQVRGEYITVDPPRLLEFTWAPSWDGYVESNVRCEIEPTASGCHLTLVHSGLANPNTTKSHGEGWVRVFTWLRKYMAVNS